MHTHTHTHSHAYCAKAAIIDASQTCHSHRCNKYGVVVFEIEARLHPLLDGSHCTLCRQNDARMVWRRAARRLHNIYRVSHYVHPRTDPIRELTSDSDSLTAHTLSRAAELLLLLLLDVIVVIVERETACQALSRGVGVCIRLFHASKWLLFSYLACSDKFQ